MKTVVLFANLKQIFFRLILTKAEVLVFIGIIMGYFNHPLWELIFSILGNLAVLICFVIVVLYKKKH